MYKWSYYLMLLSCILLISCDSIDESKELYDWYFDELDYNEYKNIDCSDVLIGVIDTGIILEVYNHISTDIVSRYNFVEDNDNIICNDIYHGSNTISLIKGYGEMKGFAPKSKLIPIVACDSNGITTADYLVKGIKYAIEKSVNILCIALGSYVDNEDVHKAIVEANKKNIIIVSSAGDKKSETILYPARYDGVYAIASQNKSGRLAYFSNFSDKCILIPGNDIKVIQYYSDIVYYGIEYGSSYATAIFAGILGCLYAKFGYNGVENKIKSFYYNDEGFFRI